MKYPIMLSPIEVQVLNRLRNDVMRSIDMANWHLDPMINDLRHTMNDQLIDLKYGKGYKASFLDDILIQVNNL